MIILMKKNKFFRCFCFEVENRFFSVWARKISVFFIVFERIVRNFRYRQSAFHEISFSFRVDVRFDVIRWNFSNFSACVRLWLCLFMSTCSIVYYCFHFWAYKRLSLIPTGSSLNSSTEKTNKTSTKLGFSYFFRRAKFLFHRWNFLSVLFDWLWFFAYCAYIAVFLFLPVHYILAENYPIVTRMIILIEQVSFRWSSMNFRFVQNASLFRDENSRTWKSIHRIYSFVFLCLITLLNFSFSIKNFSRTARR